MHMIDIVLIVLIAAAVIAAVIGCIRTRKKGRSCGCGGSNCSGCCGCGTKKNAAKKPK